MLDDPGAPGGKDVGIESVRLSVVPESETGAVGDGGSMLNETPTEELVARAELMGGTEAISEERMG